MCLSNSTITAVLHDIATPALGEATKAVDPKNLHEEDHWCGAALPNKTNLSYLCGKILKNCMAYNRRTFRGPAIDWDRVREVVEPLEPELWELICSEGNRVDDRRLRVGGYTLTRLGFKNYAPRFEYSAELMLPEPTGISSREIDNLMDHVTKHVTVEGSDLKFILDIQPIFPMIGSLERDNVFGPNPEVSPYIDYTIRPSREDLERLFPKL